MSIPLQHPFLDFLCHFPNLRCPSYVFICYLVQLRNSICTSIVAFSFLRPPINFPVPSSMPLSLSRTPLPVLPLSCNISFDLHANVSVKQHSRHSLPFLPSALHYVGDFRIQSSILRQRRPHVCEYVLPFMYSVLFLLIFNHRSSIALLHSSSFISTCSLHTECSLYKSNFRP